MGMTRSFYYIVNKGFSKGQMAEAMASEMKRTLPKVDREAAGMLADLMKILEMNECRLGGSIMAYREDARMFPYFDANICEGYTASSREDAMLSERFKAPVLSFAAMDSDVLFVSYCDKERGAEFDCAIANCPGMEDELFDVSVYKLEFPSFLLEYCNEEDRGRLRSIWESGDYSFAEEKMEDIGSLMGVEFMYCEEDIPEGYEALESSE